MCFVISAAIGKVGIYWAHKRRKANCHLQLHAYSTPAPSHLPSEGTRGHVLEGFMCNRLTVAVTWQSKRVDTLISHPSTKRLSCSNHWRVWSAFCCGMCPNYMSLNLLSLKYLSKKNTINSYPVSPFPNAFFCVFVFHSCVLEIYELLCGTYWTRK